MPTRLLAFLGSLGHKNPAYAAVSFAPHPVAGLRSALPAQNRIPFEKQRMASKAHYWATRLDGYNQKSALATMPRTRRQNITGTGILTRCPSPTLIRLGLGPTNPGVIIMAQETSLFRWAGFSPALWLLIPAFSLDNAPPGLPARLHCRYQRSSTATL